MAQAHDFITRFPDGYDSVVGQRGFYQQLYTAQFQATTNIVGPMETTVAMA